MNTGFLLFALHLPERRMFNEWYAKDTSNKIKSIFLSRMNDGKRCSGSIPYGYNRLPEDKQTLVVDPVASQVVKHIFELAAEGLTPPAIARQLTEEKVLIPSAYTLQYHPEQCNRKAEYGCTSWNANTVREILSRQEYLGHTVLRKTIGTNFKTDERRFATDEERLVFEDTHEPIVDSELWEQAHRRLKHATRRIKEGTHQEECLLPGLVYCADCVSKMSYQTNYYKSGEPYHSFRCSSYGNRTVNCTIHHISDKVLYQLVLRSIQRLSSHIIADERGFAEELKSKWEAQANGKPQKQKEELQTINRRLNELDSLIGSLYENFISGLLPEKQYKSLMKKYSAEQDSLENQVSEIELFTDGSLNTFAKHTNVDTHSRLICYDILDLGKQLQPIGMLVVLDSILNRITQNRAKGRNTFIFIDEIYLLFQHEYSANFLFTLWKRVRKYGAYCTGITQNVDDLLQSHTARTMLANSEFIIMLNQASTDRIELAKLLNISDLQLSYITNVGAGQGLLKVGSSLVPFVNKFPRNTELYKLMTTKFGEV